MQPACQKWTSELGGVSESCLGKGDVERYEPADTGAADFHYYFAVFEGVTAGELFY
jgi:hypothetical protein